MAQKITSLPILKAARTILESGVDPEQPFFIFDADSVRQKVKILRSSCANFFNNFEISSSLKFCSLGLFCRIMADEGVSAEACSIEEMYMSSAAGFPHNRIMLDGPLKLSKELSYAVQNNILILVDGVEELERLEKIAAKQGKQCGVGIRLSHMYRENKPSRFGVTEDEYLTKILPLLSKSSYLHLAGFHLHTGSNQSGSRKLIENLSNWLPFLIENLPAGGHLSLGCDLSAEAFSESVAIETLSPEVFFRELHELLGDYVNDYHKKWKLIFESGRYLSEENGYLCGKAFGSKWRYNAEVIQTNLGMNWVPSIHKSAHSFTVIDAGSLAEPNYAQVAAGYNSVENDTFLPVGRHGFRKGCHFLIRGCGSYDLQTGAEWSRRKPTVYALLDGKIELARIQPPESELVPRDLLHKSDSIIVRANLVLSAPSRNYARGLYTIINENRDYFSEFMAWPRFVTSENDTAEFMDSCQLSHQKNVGKTYIILHENTPVGLLSFNSIDNKNKAAYIGYWLDPKMQGKGIVTEALNALVNHYSGGELIKRFVITCSTQNTASNNVAKRCGFQLEGKLHDAELINGIFHHQNIYAKIV
ncbi:GNAT family N-acetyltransferase [Xenorhabdus sp. 12]|uniref:GNAT family N-acetyltransferase n=1 Tax=Xenorhabdus santafensis TaxID=2582833 RepID=A0ABU4S5Z6_9GAMM|nr:GNAT family N-acetyltransferase [Xenorhabdus sp. 12]MDX7986054.1 GNAT family N-acetyltransferase [Xenorhabdus sp. 12]